MDEQASAAMDRSGRRPWSPLDPIITAAFWTLAVIILLNTRGIFPQGVNTGMLVFAGLRVLCCLLLMALVHVRLPQALGKSGALLLGSMASYLVIGFFVSIATDAELLVNQYGIDLYGYVWGTAIPLTLILSAPLGGYALLERVGMQAFLRSLLMVLTASSAVIVFTPALQSMGVLLPQEMLPSVTASRRFTGAFWNPNDAGFIGCMTAALALAFLGNVRRPVLAYVALTAGFLATVASGSKTAILSLAVVTVFFLLLNGHHGRGRILLGMGAVSLIGAIVVQNWLLTRSLLIRLLSIVALVSEGVFNDVTLSQRGSLWRLGLRHSLESPIVGHGLGRFYFLDDSPISPDLGIASGAHNTYLLLVGEAGILPLSLYLLHLFSLLRLRWTIPKSLARDAIVVWTIIIALQGMVSHQVFQAGFYAFLGSVACAMASYAARGPGGGTGETPRTSSRTHAAPSAAG